MKNLGLLLTGIALGIGLAGPAAQAAENWCKASPSGQAFYVDGHKVNLEAYEINGYNYIKLRDIGQAVGFNVSYHFTLMVSMFLGWFLLKIGNLSTRGL